jgi:hypothetical protein
MTKADGNKNSHAECGKITQRKEKGNNRTRKKSELNCCNFLNIILYCYVKRSNFVPVTIHPSCIFFANIKHQLLFII